MLKNTAKFKSYFTEGIKKFVVSSVQSVVLMLLVFHEKYKTKHYFNDIWKHQLSKVFECNMNTEQRTYFLKTDNSIKCIYCIYRFILPFIIRAVVHKLVNEPKKKLLVRFIVIALYSLDVKIKKKQYMRQFL